MTLIVAGSYKEPAARNALKLMGRINSRHMNGCNISICFLPFLRKLIYIDSSPSAVHVYTLQTSGSTTTRSAREDIAARPKISINGS